MRYLRTLLKPYAANKLNIKYKRKRSFVHIHLFASLFEGCDSLYQQVWYKYIPPIAACQKRIAGFYCLTSATGSEHT
jgi:hypothetical protein